MMMFDRQPVAANDDKTKMDQKNKSVFDVWTDFGVVRVAGC